MHRPLLLTFVFAAVVCSSLSFAIAKDPPGTVMPVPRDGDWMKRHESFNERAKQGDVDLIFLGDSITQGWEGKGAVPIWDKYYGGRKAMNAGIGGDRTQHVLWRLDNGNIAGIKPKLAVIMIGTNNAGSDSSGRYRRRDQGDRRQAARQVAGDQDPAVGNLSAR